MGSGGVSFRVLSKERRATGTKKCHSSTLATTTTMLMLATSSTFVAVSPFQTTFFLSFSHMVMEDQSLSRWLSIDASLSAKTQNKNEKAKERELTWSAASNSCPRSQKKKLKKKQAGGLDERTISRDEWAARLRAARVAPAALNAIVMDFLVTEVRRGTEEISTQSFFLLFLCSLRPPLSLSTSSPFFSLSLLSKPPHPPRATSRPPRPSRRSLAPSPAPISPRPRGATPSGPLWRRATSTLPCLR